MSRADSQQTSASDALAPTTGARYLLERDGEPAQEGSRARYRAAIYTASEAFEGHAELGDDGSVALEPGLVGVAPAELVDRLAMFAKLLARGAAKRREDGLPVWPARVLRWRGE